MEEEDGVIILDLSEKALNYLDKFAEENGLNRDQALEEIVMSCKEQMEQEEIKQLKQLKLLLKMVRNEVARLKQKGKTVLAITEELKEESLFSYIQPTQTSNEE